MSWRSLESNEAHSGYDFGMFNLCGSCQYHDFHHSHNIGNYGIGTFWDELMGTNVAFLKYKNNEKSLEIRRDFTLQEIINDDLYKKYFKSHLEKEHCVESVLFYEKVQRYQKLPDEEIVEKGREIFKEFLVEGSEYEINTSLKIKNQARNDIENGKKDAFKEILGEVVQNSLKPSLVRFLNDDLFIKMQKEKIE